MRCGQFDGLVELATICALCNDSALDYNEVGPLSCSCPPSVPFLGTDPFPLPRVSLFGVGVPQCFKGSHSTSMVT